MGQNGSTIHTVTFDNVRVPASQMMGKENDGFRIAAGELAAGRIGIAAMSLGISRAAYDYALNHAKERRQFNSRIADFQGIQWMLADRATEMEAARLLILQAAHMQDEGKPFTHAASMAKLYASETCGRVTDTAVQLCGGSGYIKPNPVERYVRDARITRIYEGTSEVQRMVIAREIIRQ
jgi:acyl-CoA dehydrogenase